MTTQRSPRRIVPPAMPMQTSAAQPVAYEPPKYTDPSEESWTKLVLIGLASFVVVGGGLFALQAMQSPPDPAILAAIQERAAELQVAAQPSAGDDASAPGWVGVLELPLERATVSITTIPDSGVTTRQWNENTKEPVSLAMLSIDNTAGDQEISVDTSRAMLQMMDGSSRRSVDPAEVLTTLKADAQAATREHSPPFQCSVGQRVTGKYIFLPPGTDPHAITSVKLTINGQEREILGSYMERAQKFAVLRARMQPPLGATTQGTDQARN